MKMTDRDKILLILLGVILVVALAAIFPTFGVMDCLNSKKEKQAAIAELDVTLAGELEGLRADFGDAVAAKAEDANGAKKEMEKQIQAKEEEIRRLAGNVLGSSKNSSINTVWLNGLEYLNANYAVGEEDEEGENTDLKIVGVAYDDDQSSSDTGAPKDVFKLANNNEVELRYYGRTIDVLPRTDYCVYFTSEEDKEAENSVIFSAYADDARDLGALLLYLEHLSAKGSILIEGITYSEALNAEVEKSLGQAAGSSESEDIFGYKISAKILMTSGQNILPEEEPEEEE